MLGHVPSLHPQAPHGWWCFSFGLIIIGFRRPPLPCPGAKTQSSAAVLFQGSLIGMFDILYVYITYIYNCIIILYTNQLTSSMWGRGRCSQPAQRAWPRIWPSERRRPGEKCRTLCVCVTLDLNKISYNYIYNYYTSTHTHQSY